MNKENIKSTIMTAGWQDIKQMALEEIGEEQKVTSIKTKGKSDAIIASELRAKQDAAQIIKKWLNKLEKIESEPKPKPKRSFV